MAFLVSAMFVAAPDRVSVLFIGRNSSNENRRTRIVNGDWRTWQSLPRRVIVTSDQTILTRLDGIRRVDVVRGEVDLQKPIRLGSQEEGKFSVAFKDVG
jgi:hypothetical protein